MVARSLIWSVFIVLLTVGICGSAELLYFGRRDCPHCPAAKRLAEKMKAAGHKVYVLDGQKDKKLNDAWKVDAYPTFVVVDPQPDGKAKETWRSVGKPSEFTLRRKLR